MGLVAILLAGCGGGGDDTGGDTRATVSGTVRSLHTGDVLPGAAVSMGTRQATADAAGRFELTNVGQGAATLRSELTGFETYEASVTVAAGSNTHDVAMARKTIFEFSTFAVYIPADVPSVQGAVFVLGGFGNDSRGFATGGPIGAGPDVEPGRQALGEMVRALARAHGLAVIGSSRTQEGYDNSPESDNHLLTSLETAGIVSGRAELARAPVLVVGISRGGREASGLASRQPNRVAGLVLSVPASAEQLMTAEARGVPTVMIQAEFDSAVDNRVTALAFGANRAAGALWGMGVVPGANHTTYPASARAFMENWMGAVASLRLPAGASGVLPAIAEESGWLGDLTTFEIAAWASYGGDRGAAAWLPTQALAQEWQSLVTP